MLILWMIFYVQATQQNKAKIGFEVELPNYTYLGQAGNILNNKGDKWSLDTDSPNNKKDGFNLEYTSEPFEIIDTVHIAKCVTTILEHFHQELPNTKRSSDNGVDISNKMLPQITFQIGLEYIPAIFKHLYILTNHEKLKKILTDQRYKDVFHTNKPSKLHGMLALFILYVESLFEKDSIPSMSMFCPLPAPNLKWRVPIMSRLSFSKMYYSLSEPEKLEFIQQVHKIFKESILNKKVLIYYDYSTPSKPKLLVLSISDWLDSILRPQGLLLNNALNTTALRILKEKYSNSTNRLMSGYYTIIKKIIEDEENIIKYTDLLSPPPQLGRDERETGMGGGDYLQIDPTHGDALIEIRSYRYLSGSPLIINYLPYLIENERFFIQTIINTPNLMQKEFEKTMVHLFQHFLPDQRFTEAASKRIEEVYQQSN